MPKDQAAEPPIVSDTGDITLAHHMLMIIPRNALRSLPNFIFSQPCYFSNSYPLSVNQSSNESYSCHFVPRFSGLQQLLYISRALKGVLIGNSGTGVNYFIIFPHCTLVLLFVPLVRALSAKDGATKAGDFFFSFSSSFLGGAWAWIYIPRATTAPTATGESCVVKKESIADFVLVYFQLGGGRRVVGGGQ
ncbi:hypothetical protein SODALDRAFT_77720 [Sodiomyces alkalinus F11]|uniref:Uncharacterized protein n=1 Tax=Sodiomyces alkalinus (strain CBS 110278 / VKM F-3762 / F11) TaxID=1314773 RepID=A0A3N2PL99_SODAK|nr:hypothetical protein SODALDRAFT_77720 [Sodiomyces alkalinus F11]ROT35106.1 hypothetical protein SODALDRAFT_77720 [Sodiomyces alkalinus F11]